VGFGAKPQPSFLPPAERLDRLRLARTDTVGPISFRRLLERHGSATAAIDALPNLAQRAGRAFAVPSRRDAEREIAFVERLGGRMLVWGDDAYPPLLAQTEDAPPVLGVLGDPALLSRDAVAVVGSRNASANGRSLAESLGAALAEAGLAVVSGLARGIDAAAHAGALATGATIAAVAGGLDVPYPPEHAALQQRIAEAGCVVSEAPPGTAPQARHFPRRNRIIAGLALGVVVVEAAPRSGSLLTARLALEAGRELFAVPGSPLDPRCRGSNGLLRDGAWLTETAEDVLAQLRPGGAPRRAADVLPGFAEPLQALAADPAAACDQVVELLSHSPTSVDDLMRRCQLSAASVLAALVDLELTGRAELLPGNRAVLLR
jgi:DNA processing protein